MINYTKTNWKNNETPITADKLNKIEDTLYALCEALNGVSENSADTREAIKYFSIGLESDNVLVLKFGDPDNTILNERFTVQLNNNSQANSQVFHHTLIVGNKSQSYKIEFRNLSSTPITRANFIGYNPFASKSCDSFPINYVKTEDKERSVIISTLCYPLEDEVPDTRVEYGDQGFGISVGHKVDNCNDEITLSWDADKINNTYDYGHFVFEDFVSPIKNGGAPDLDVEQEAEINDLLHELEWMGY